jgi:hypothetical protein
MSKNKDNVWEVLVKGATCESADIFEKVAELNLLREKGKIKEEKFWDRIEELEDRDEEFSLEISVIKKDNEHGHESYGYGDENKIILWSTDGSAGNEMSTEDVHWCKNVAQLLCDSMNKNNM